MKLKSSFVTQKMGDKQIMVSTDSSGFSGMVRSNQTAAFIVECLKEETTKEKITDTLFVKYDAPRNVIEKDVETVLEKLRSIGALEE